MRRFAIFSMPAPTSCRSTSLTCRRGPEEARAFGLAALNRALENVVGTTAVHICFGYAAIIHVRPSGYSFLPELAECRCAQVSIETAQSNLDCAVLKQLPGKKIIFGVIDLPDPDGRDAGGGGEPHPPRPALCRSGESSDRAGLRHEVPAAPTSRSESCKPWWPARRWCARNSKRSRLGSSPEITKGGFQMFTVKRRIAVDSGGRTGSASSIAEPGGAAQAQRESGSEPLEEIVVTARKRKKRCSTYR